MREQYRRVCRSINYSGKNARSGAAEALLGEKSEESGEGKRGNAEKGEGVPNGISDRIIVETPERVSILFVFKGWVCPQS